MSHDTTLFLLRSAAQLHRDVHQQQLHGLATSADAEDRAFHAERMQQQVEAQLRIEREEHNLTKVALQRLLAQNVGLKQTVRQLVDRWAPQEGRDAEEMQIDLVRRADAKADHIEKVNRALLTQDMELLRDAKRPGLCKRTT